MTSAAAAVGGAAATVGVLGVLTLMVMAPVAGVAPRVAVMTAAPTPTAEMVPAASTVATAPLEVAKVKYGRALAMVWLPPFTEKVTDGPSTGKRSPVCLLRVSVAMAGAGGPSTDEFSVSYWMSSNQTV